MKHILFATDFTHECEEALDFLLQVIKNRPIKIDLTHVFNIPFIKLTSYSKVEVTNFISNEKAILNLELKNWMEKIPKPNQGNFHLIYGSSISSSIANKAKIEEVDLIVIALRDHYASIHSVIGTVTTKVLEKCNIPLLAIPSGIKYESIENVLFPTSVESINNLSNNERKAIIYLNELLGNETPHRVLMLHSVLGDGLDIVYRKTSEPIDEFIVNMSKTIERGVLFTAESKSVDLIALFKSNKNFWTRMLNTSLMRKLITSQKIPLLLFSETIEA